MDLGAIVRLELIRTARLRRHYAARSALGLVLLYVAWVLQGYLVRAATTRNGELGLVPFSYLRPFADFAFVELTMFQGLVMLLLVPGLAAGSISTEDRRGTMLHLLATPLSSGSILLGKLAARLLPLGMAVGIGLPIVLALLLLGALDSRILIYYYLLLIALAVFAASLSILVAVIVPRPSLAIPAAYFVVGGWFLLPVWFSPVAGRALWPFAWLGTVNEWLLSRHPLAPAIWLRALCEARLSYPPAVAWLWPKFGKSFPRVMELQGAGSSLALVLAAVCLRPLRLGRWSLRGRGPASSSRPPISARESFGDNPMLWKEWYAPARYSGAAARVIAVLLGLLLFCPLIGPALAAFATWRASWSGGPGHGWASSGGFNDSLRQLNAGLYVLGLVAVAAGAATSISGERERGTWTSLALAPVTGQEIVRAKVAGALWAVRGLLVPFVAIGAIGLLTSTLR